LDMEKLLRWREFAQKMQGKDFWSSLFDNNNQQSTDLMSGFAKMMDADASFPRADVYQKDTEIIVLIEMPGMRKEDVQLKVLGDRLEVKGVIPLPYPPNYNVTTERFHGPFERTIQLPTNVKREGVKAKFINGLLEVHLPRSLNATLESIEIE